MDRTVITAITHIHTTASNGPASALDRVVRQALTSAFGGRYPAGLVWRECFTTIDDLSEILAGRRTVRPVDLIFITDHVSAERHMLDPEASRLAAGDPRVCLGAEVQTCCLDPDPAAGWLKAPEVLVYGSGRPVGCGYTGIDQPLLDRLYAECSPAGAPQPLTLAVARFCRQNRLACVLAHPFDSHELPLAETLRIISAFGFVETVNGGFPNRSAEALSAWIGFHNQVASGEVEPAVLAPRLTPFQRRLLSAAGQGETIVPFGGSDAHLADFDRVVTRFRTGRHAPTAAGMIEAMLGTPTADLVRDRVFEPDGRGCSAAYLYREVAGIMARNISANRAFFGNPLNFVRTIRECLLRGPRELSYRLRRNATIGREYRHRVRLKRMQRLARLPGGTARGGTG